MFTHCSHGTNINTVSWSPHSVPLGLGPCWMQGSLAQFYHVSLVLLNKTACQVSVLSWPWKFWGTVALCSVESINCPFTFFFWWFQQGFWDSWKRASGKAPSNHGTVSIGPIPVAGALGHLGKVASQLLCCKVPLHLLPTPHLWQEAAPHSPHLGGGCPLPHWGRNTHTNGWNPSTWSGLPCVVDLFL